MPHFKSSKSPSCAQRKKKPQQQKALEDLRYARHRRGTKPTKPHEKKVKRKKWKPEDEPE
jgi:hypothetical protein